MKLLEKYQLGPYELKNRIAMAPMTRARANADGTVSESTLKYYEQRASAGLIITEAINISEQAIGMPLTSGLFTTAQVESWKKVTNAVHAAGGRIFAQLFHAGRVAHSAVKGGAIPVAPSAIKIEGQQAFTLEGMKDFETPHALTTEEVKAVVKDYETAARNALEAGFDGVELHAATGFLPSQFLVDGSNKRTDEYGGTIENRSRFVLEILRSLIGVYGEGKVGIKLSPSIPHNNMIDTDPTALFNYLIAEVNKFPLAYLQLMQPMFPIDAFPHWPKDVVSTFGHLFDKTLIANVGYDKDSGNALIENGAAQMVSYGRLFVANPDLPKRFEQNLPFNELDQATMYGGGDAGYIDYPTLVEEVAK